MAVLGSLRFDTEQDIMLFGDLDYPDSLSKDVKNIVAETIDAFTLSIENSGGSGRAWVNGEYILYFSSEIKRKHGIRGGRVKVQINWNPDEPDNDNLSVLLTGDWMQGETWAYAEDVNDAIEELDEIITWDLSHIGANLVDDLELDTGD